MGLELLVANAYRHLIRLRSGSWRLRIVEGVENSDGPSVGIANGDCFHANRLMNDATN
jgi:hypothetical protein